MGIRNKVHRHVLRVRRRRLDVVPDTQVQRQIRPDPPVILEEETEVVVVRVGIHRNVLAHGIRRTEEEVRNGCRRMVRRVRVRGELEDTVVIQRGLLRVILTARLAAVVQRVLSTRRAHDVADGIHVCCQSQVA